MSQFCFSKQQNIADMQNRESMSSLQMEWGTSFNFRLICWYVHLFLVIDSEITSYKIAVVK
jgi:hypothetical protein